MGFFDPTWSEPDERATTGTATTRAGFLTRPLPMPIEDDELSPEISACVKLRDCMAQPRGFLDGIFGSPPCQGLVKDCAEELGRDITEPFYRPELNEAKSNLAAGVGIAICGGLLLWFLLRR